MRIVIFRRAAAVIAAATLAAAPMLGPLTAAPAAAQSFQEPGDKAEEDRRGRPLDERYFEERLMTPEMRRAIANLIAAVGPVVRQFAEMIEDLPQYEAPEILPNGDIIIRRKRGDSDGDGDGDEIKT